MKKFRNPFDDDPKTFRATNSGNRYYTEARVIFDPDGNMHLESGKERDRIAEIQSYKDSCDVNLLIKRYQNGDQTALLRDNTGVFCDLSSMPTNNHEAVKLSRNVESLYDSLGDDFKVLYPSLGDFLGAFSDQTKFDRFVNDANQVISSRVNTFNAAKAAAKAKEEAVNA